LLQELDFIRRDFGDDVVADEAVEALPLAVDQDFFGLPDVTGAIVLRLLGGMAWVPDRELVERLPAGHLGKHGQLCQPYFGFSIPEREDGAGLFDVVGCGGVVEFGKMKPWRIKRIAKTIE